jgi:sec-independent protein translocase protein TatA
MGSFSPIHLIILAVAALLLFGGRIKLSAIMGDAATGIKAFREGLRDEPATPAPAPALPAKSPENEPLMR